MSVASQSACRALFTLLGIVACGLSSAADPSNTFRASSPDGELGLTVAVREAGGLSYSVSWRGAPLIGDSRIRVRTQDGAVLGDRVTLPRAEPPREHRGEWKPLYGEQAQIEDNYNELVVAGRDVDSGVVMTVEFRCYNEGLALRTRLHRPGGGGFALRDELTEFRLPSDAPLWVTTDAQGIYEKTVVSASPDEIERPLVAELDPQRYVALTEAALVDYARCLFSPLKQGAPGLVTDLTGGVKTEGDLVTPWRVALVGESPGELLENNGVILSLNEPCAIEDTSWIRPGKVLREITLTTAGGLAAVDHAAAYGFRYLLFDAGWYGHEYDNASDATTISVDPKRSPGPLDLHRIIKYAKQHDIGVIVYVNRRALERQLDEILPLYKSWGLAGVKYGFVQHGPQKWNAWVHEAIRKAAENELVVDIHDIYRPTGYSRTYPNLLTQEGVRGDEASPPAEQTLISLFTRSLAGGADFTYCYFDDRVDELWSHSHQLAKTVCFYSPLQFIYWYDTPLEDATKRQIVATPEQEFFRYLPTTWDETKVVHGKIGEYAVIARRSGDDWFIGCLNAAEPRTLEVPLDFLADGADFEATFYRDDETVDTPTRVRIDKAVVGSATVLKVKLGANSGEAIRLVPRGE